MGSKPRISAGRRLRPRASNSYKNLSKPEINTHSTHIGRNHGGGSISDKLQALKSLIPSHSENAKADELFEETADYIVLLKTQVLVLQKLIDFYGSQPRQENDNAV
ncbi:transcription factor UPBEAT1-like [Olea europaea subsp. europaea]|uniref:Transcription factor UPBEAT1-like n=1 Tax=Olea europaea subsp. europaea TaxID=158383 RepID=A0A8S0PYI6_OLEEU|nr:transcription factor UPBEAT1-like [Olea europaea subsp. europaea]